MFKESNILIILDALRKIMNIFYGPFLTLYFIKISAESIAPLSYYYIISFLFLGIGSFIMGFIVRKKFQLEMFRIGIIINFIYVLAIILLKEDIVNHLFLIALLFGISASCYYYPYNLLLGKKVGNKIRSQYELNRKIVITITDVVAPIVLGGMITTTNFELTAFVILFMSLLQIIFSFFISPIENKNYKFTPIKSLKTFMKNKNIINVFMIDFVRGLNISDSVLQVILTILIFNSFKTDFNVGIISSLSYVLVIVLEYLYVNKVKDKNNKLLLYSFSLIPIISLFLLSCYTNNFTLILYYFCYNGLVNVLLFLSTIKIFNVSNCREVRDDNLMEYWSIREFLLNMGRVTGYVLLFLVFICGGFNYLYILMMILTLSIFVLSYLLSETDNYDNID